MDDHLLLQIEIVLGFDPDLVCLFMRLLENEVHLAAGRIVCVASDGVLVVTIQRESRHVTASSI